MSNPREVLLEVIKQWDGATRTHHDVCYVNHAECLAQLVLHILDES